MNVSPQHRNLSSSRRPDANIPSARVNGQNWYVQISRHVSWAGVVTNYVKPAQLTSRARQQHEGWRLVPKHYDDGAFSGASLDRPALQELPEEVRVGKIDVIVVYKIDWLTRSLTDFAKLVELFDRHSVSFVSVIQSFNTTSSMGRLTLNVLLSFAQFEHEVIGGAGTG